MHLVEHTKADLDNHANQLNPNNPRYAGHQERLAAAAMNREATTLHQEAQAAYQYANQIEAGTVYFLNLIIIIFYLAAMQEKVAADQLNQQASFYAQQAAAGLNTRGGDFFYGFYSKVCIFLFVH
jgi:hypothetical protein